jgi:spore germination protein
VTGPTAHGGRIRAAFAVIFAVLVATAALAAASPHRPAFEITGYASDWTPEAIVAVQAPALTDVGVDGVGVTVSGTSVEPPTARALGLLHASHHDGLRVSLLVGNWGGPSGTSPAVAARLLTSSANVVRVASHLANLVRHEGWNGITVDLESLTSSDGPGLVAFVTALHSRLPRSDLLAVDVAACSSKAQDVGEGYLLSSLAREARVVLMAYDEHGSWSGPGAIGGVPWVERTVDVARSQVPASRLVLGIGAYGYEWPPGRRHLGSTAVTVTGARQLAATTRRGPRWDAAMGEWTVRLQNRTVLWWSDSRSIGLRERVAKRLHLGGVAIWQLASSDRLPAR